MSDQLKRVHEHMVGLGLGALAHANWHANYFNPDNRYWSELSVLQAAHACEILIKARISQEHPLLVFEQLPKQESNGAPLSLQRLIEGGRTYQFADLPDRLWAVTGLKLPAVDRYRAFGRLRNSIQHFAVPPNIEVSAEAIKFIYEVIDPFIHECWGLYAVDYNEDTEQYKYLVEGLIRCGIRFLVPPHMMDEFEWVEIEWPEDGGSYQQEMETRFADARTKRKMELKLPSNP